MSSVREPEPPPDGLAEDVRFGSLTVSQGLCTREQVDECLAILRELARQGQRPLPRLGGLLLQKGYLGQAESGRTLMIQDRPSAGTREGTAERPARPADPELPAEAEAALGTSGSLVGKYIRVRLLGVGGMGEVWKAWDRELKRWVALKFLKHDDPKEQSRFRAEAQAAASLDHPNICAVYEVGRHEGRPFISMQLVQGRTLQSYPRGDRRELAGIFRAVALAVQRAHEAGIVHRDLKPANIMVNDRKDVFVMDFGLAKSTQVESSVSISGAVVGTPAYMSPEQAKGRKDVDGRADVYSLGATMYEVFGGEPLYEGSGVYDILLRIAEEEPRPLRRRNPQFDRELDTIVMKCLEKDPVRRYSTAAELAEDLRRWLDHEPILAHPPSVFYKLKKRLLKRKTIVRLSAVVALALAALGAVALRWRAAQRTAQDTQAELAAEQLASLAEHRMKAAARPYLDLGTRVLGQIELMLRYKGAPLEPLAEKAEAHFRSALQRSPALPEAHLGIARVHLLMGRRKEALAQIEEAIRVEKTFATAYLDRIRLEILEYEEESRFQADRTLLLNSRAEALQKEIKRDLERFQQFSKQKERGPEHDLAEGVVELSHGRPPKAVEFLTSYLQAVPADGLARYWRGHALFRMGRIAEAEDDFTRALEFDARNGAAREGRAMARLRQNRLDAALEDVEELLVSNPKDALARLLRGNVRLAKGDLKGAIEDYTESARLRYSWEVFYQVAQAYVRQRKPDDAMAHLVTGLALTGGDRRIDSLLLRQLSWISFELASVSFEPRRVRATRRYVESALLADPKDADMLFIRARLRAHENDPAGASADLKSAFEHAPADWPPRPAAEALRKELDSRR